VTAKVSSKFDPFVIESLVLRYPVPGASEGERREAAVILYERGWGFEQTAAVLRMSVRDVELAVKAEQKRRGRERRARAC